jgi:ornithine cyclodeaminase/alanine dehydrogenase-like protein (mu-crystallin family)
MIRYLSEAEVERARPTVREGIDLARLALVALAEGRAQLPPKPSVYPRTGAFSNVMPAYVEDVGHGDQLGLKWVSVYNGNTERGLPIINGIVLICETDTGLPRALMAAGFLTGIRTAAVSGACLEALAPADVGHVAITGAGVQTRSHLEVCEELGHHRVRVLVRRQASGDAVVAWAAEHTPQVEVTVVSSAADAVAGAGAIITGLPIGTEGALLDPATVRDDALLLPLDWGTSVGADIGNAARLFADDVPQFQRIAERGSFPGYRAPDGYSGEAVQLPRPPGRVVCQNLGQGAADLLFGNAIATNADRDDVGTLLER